MADQGGPTTMRDGAPQPPQPPQPPVMPPVGRGGMPQEVGQRPQGTIPGVPYGPRPTPQWPMQPQWAPQPQWMPTMPPTPQQWMPPMQMGWPGPWHGVPNWPPQASLGWAAGMGSQPAPQSMFPPGAPAGWLAGSMMARDSGPGYGPPIMPPPSFPSDGRAIDGGPIPLPVLPPQQINPPQWQPQDYPDFMQGPYDSTPQQPGGPTPWQAPWYGQHAF